MDILAHRGLWHLKDEQNTLKALEASFFEGFGVETDIRDLNGNLVISHDMPTGKPLLVDQFFTVYREAGSSAPLALNVKSDGLQKDIQALLTKHSIENYFVFDMSVPDTLGYLRNRIKFFSRSSEYETVVALEGDADGIWLDCFIEAWKPDRILSFLAKGKKVCLVSPELHKREFKNAWETCRSLMTDLSSKERDLLMICTDFPREARDFFLI